MPGVVEHLCNAELLRERAEHFITHFVEVDEVVANVVEGAGRGGIANLPDVCIARQRFFA